MVTAIVLFNIERGQVSDVAQLLVDMPDITEVYSVSGNYDLVAIVRSNENEKIADLITDQMQKTDGIQKTETMFAFRTCSRHDLERMFSVGANA